MRSARFRGRRSAPSACPRERPPSFGGPRWPRGLRRGRRAHEGHGRFQFAARGAMLAALGTATEQGRKGMATIVCRWPDCKKETSAAAKHCTHCGRNPRSTRDLPWTGKRLAIADSADTVPFVAEVFGEGPETDPILTVSVPAVRWALSRLAGRRQQIMIRLCGLDNGGRRTLTQVADEAHISERSVVRNRGAARWALRHPVCTRILLGRLPVPEAQSGSFRPPRPRPSTGG
jgi:hypothetical protein